METIYYIDLHIQTPKGFETYGTFYLGNNREKANAIFNELHGTDEIGENSILHIDFTEIQDGIPLPIKILHCTIEDIAINSKIITREVFKNLALKTD